MTTTNEKPIFIPPKKRSAKRQGEAQTLPMRVHCYDIITSLPCDEYKKVRSDSPTELLMHSSPAHMQVKPSPIHKLNNIPAKKGNAQDGDEPTDYSKTCSDVKPRASENSPSISFDTEVDVEAVSEKSALNDEKSVDSYITMTGTIKRGKKAGQSVGVRLNMSREELEDLESSIISQKPEAKKAVWSVRKGIHVLLWTILCIPFVVILSGSYSFYLGTLTWYNVYLFYNEERTIWHKILVCPLLLFSFPFLIVSGTIGLGLYAAVIQVSWNYDMWWAEIQDFEKGFYGWLCNAAGLDDCAPYEVVILNDGPPPVGAKLPVGDTAL